MGTTADTTQRKTVPLLPRVRVPSTKPAPISQIRERVRPQLKEDAPPTEEAGTCYSVVHPRTRPTTPWKIPPR